jgi:hypothetical protein
VQACGLLTFWCFSILFCALTTHYQVYTGNLCFNKLLIQENFLILGIILLIGQIADGIATPFVGLQVGDAYSNQRMACDIKLIQNLVIK